MTVNKKSEIFIDQERVNLVDFRKRFLEVFRGRVNVPVFFSGDRQVPYGVALRIISEIQNAGAVKLGFLSEPLEKAGGS